MSNSSKLSCMLSLPASMKRFRSRTAEKNRKYPFSHYKPMGIFFTRSRAANSAVDGPIRPKFELVRALMHVIITCKYKKERMKNSQEQEIGCKQGLQYTLRKMQIKPSKFVKNYFFRIKLLHAHLQYVCNIPTMH